MKSFYLRLFVVCLAVVLLGGTRAFGDVVPSVTRFFIGTNGEAEVDVAKFVANPGGYEVTVSAVTQGAHGMVSIGSDGRSVRYVASASFEDSDEYEYVDTFTYTVSDGSSSSTATVYVYELESFWGLHVLRLESRNGRGEMMLTVSGELTGKLTIERHTYTMRGRFDARGGALVRLSRGGRLAAFAFLDLTPGGDDLITGMYYFDLPAGGFSFYKIAGERASSGEGYAGNYTVLLPRAADQSDEMPAGAGWARMRISDKGKITLSGKLGDGTAFSTGSQLDVREEFHLFTAGRNGFSLGGGVSFTGNPYDWMGSLWWKRGKIRRGAYAAGFDGPLDMIASQFIVPRSDEAVFPFDGPQSLTLRIAGGNLDESLQTSVQVSAKFGASAQAPLVSLSAQYAGAPRRSPTGVFFGRFKVPGTKKMRSFSGVFLQSRSRYSRNTAEGFFMDGDKTGTVALTVVPSFQ